MSACVCVGGGGWQLELEEAPLLAGDEHGDLNFLLCKFPACPAEYYCVGRFFLI